MRLEFSGNLAICFTAHCERFRVCRLFLFLSFRRKARRKEEEESRRTHMLVGTTSSLEVTPCWGREERARIAKEKEIEKIGGVHIRERGRERERMREEEKERNMGNNRA